MIATMTPTPKNFERDEEDVVTLVAKEEITHLTTTTYVMSQSRVKRI